MDRSGRRMARSGLRMDRSGLRMDRSRLRMDLSGLRVDRSRWRTDQSRWRKDRCKVRIDRSRLRMDLSGLRMDFLCFRVGSSITSKPFFNLWRIGSSSWLLSQKMAWPVIHDRSTQIRKLTQDSSCLCQDMFLDFQDETNKCWVISCLSAPRETRRGLQAPKRFPHGHLYASTRATIFA
jgi:hypothetical protein